MRFHLAGDSGCLDVSQEIFIRRCCRISLTIKQLGRIVWIDGDDGTETVMLGHLGQHDCGLAFKTADFDDCAAGRHARCEDGDKGNH